MSIEKLDGSKLRHEKKPYTMHLNYVLQEVRHPLALAIWVYLSSLSEEWIVHRTQLMTHFGVGRDKISDALSYLHKNHLLSYEQDKLENGKFGKSHILIKNGYEFEVIHRNETAALKNRSTVLPLNGETAPIKEIDNKKEIEFKNKSFCHDQKMDRNQKPPSSKYSSSGKKKKTRAEWRDENAKVHDFAKAKNQTEESKKQMDREAEHIKKSEEFKRSPGMPESLRAVVRSLNANTGGGKHERRRKD